jgi:hypothetical protein
LGTGPFDGGAEQEAAHLLKQLSDFTVSVVRQEVRRAQLPSGGERDGAGAPDRRLTAGGVVGILGLATLVAAGVIVLASVLGAGLSALVVGAVLLTVGLGLILSAARRAARTN